MAYEKTEWEDSPSTASPINSTNLNHMEDGIESISNKVDLSITNPSSATTAFYVDFAKNTDNNRRVNDGFMYMTLEGKTTALGYGTLILGNSKANGTAGNKYGSIRIFSKSSNYTDLSLQSSGSNVSQTLPAVEGTIVVKQGATISTETNGWYVVNMGAYTMYFKTGQIPSQTYNMNGWGQLSGTWRNLPSGISFNSTKMVFSGNAQCADTAILYNLAVGNGGTAVGVCYNNKHAENTTAVGYYNFTLIDFS